MGRQATNSLGRGWLVTAAVACCAAVLAGPASPGQAASPVVRVDYSFTAVGGKRPPNIVESRVAAKGSLLFDTDVGSSTATASGGSGIVIVEYDILTPHPRTAQLRLQVTGGEYWRHEGQYEVTLSVVVVATDADTDAAGRAAIESCAKGERGTVQAAGNRELVAVAVTLPGCHIRHAQRARAASRNSRVQVAVTTKCLRTTASRQACGGSTTYKLDPGKTVVENVAANELTIDGAGGTARWNRCCDGATWIATFTFKVPATLVPGKSATVSLGVTVNEVKPPQPLGMQISVMAPGVKKDVFSHYPDNPSVSTNVTFTVAATTSPEMTIVVGLPMGRVTYHYVKQR